MNEKPDISLLRKYLDGITNQIEDQTVEQWLDENPENVKFLQVIATELGTSVQYNKAKVKAGILTALKNEEQRDTMPLKKFGSRVPKKRRIHPLLRVAAVLVFIIGGGLITYEVMQTRSTPEVAEIQTTSPSRTITEVTLSDGTIVELNANSTLYYPEKFPLHERVIRLDGEAFFVVASEPLRPFKVITGDVTTTVLGTQFNIQHLPNSKQTEVALLEGSILVSIDDSSKQEIILEPDQWIKYTSGSYITEVFEGIDNKIIWRKNILEFEGRTLIEVVDMLEAWYGISINTSELEALNCKVVGTFKEESLENILNGLQFVTGIKYELNEEEVILSGGSCR